jgi:hypothetical protein
VGVECTRHKPSFLHIKKIAIHYPGAFSSEPGGILLGVCLDFLTRLDKAVVEIPSSVEIEKVIIKPVLIY